MEALSGVVGPAKVLIISRLGGGQLEEEGSRASLPAGVLSVLFSRGSFADVTRRHALQFSSISPASSTTAVRVAEAP